MKKILSMALGLLFGVSALAGCSNTAPTSQASQTNSTSASTVAASAPEKLKVVATIFPQYDFVREIAGDKVELVQLLPPGAESHSFEPTPQDIIAIQESDVFIYVGGESDTWIKDIVNSIDTSNTKILSLVDMVEVKEEEIVEGMQDDHDHEEESHLEETSHDPAEESHVDEEETHDHEEIVLDEHVWTSPKNAIEIVQHLTDTLSELDPENAKVYAENAKNYITKLTELDKAFEEVVQNGVRNTIVVGDRFPLRYLADAYNLEYYAAFPGCATQTDPSASTVAFLIDKVNEENIPVVFHIELSNEKMADTICGETGAKKMLLHSCHNLSQKDRDAGATYLSLMQQNVLNLKEALG